MATRWFDPESSDFDPKRALYDNIDLTNVLRTKDSSDLPGTSFEGRTLLDFESDFIENEPDLLVDLFKLDLCDSTKQHADTLPTDDAELMNQRRARLEKTMVRTTKRRYSTMLSRIENDEYDGPLGVLSLHVELSLGVGSPQAQMLKPTGFPASRIARRNDDALRSGLDAARVFVERVPVSWSLLIIIGTWQCETLTKRITGWVIALIKVSVSWLKRQHQ